ncbi:hypothetical protein Ahy_B03g061822 isoform B [Arachis hypogaea]|uniref:Uncharacterized protein n=1 Tax=Arachis hypogaea TaxID=3818 RepID=A0A444ZS79_ARAHY|nr:hypothetical protein Ahy_B03g061822 isoform B [Arachis hypogaea]
MDDVYSSLGSLMFINIPGSDGVPGIFCSLLNRALAICSESGAVEVQLAFPTIKATTFERYLCGLCKSHL